MASLPDRVLLRQLFDYDDHGGMLRWMPRGREMFRDDTTHLVWNKRFAGKRAGFLSKYHGRRLVNIKPHIFHEHRLIWLYVNGEPVPDLINHIDGDVTNNRVDNLRAANKSQIACHAGCPRNHAIGVKGVVLLKGRYHVRIQVDGRRVHIGHFDTLAEATAARDLAAAVLHGEFARR